MHWHHRNAREASIRLAAPNFRKDLKFPPGHVEQGQTIINNSLQMIETSWLASADFIAGESLTLADFCAYQEFGQLNAKQGNLIDFGPFPKVQAWMGRMEALPFSEVANMPNAIIGDLNNGVQMETIKKANVESLKALQVALAKL